MATDLLGEFGLYPTENDGGTGPVATAAEVDSAGSSGRRVSRTTASHRNMARSSSSPVEPPTPPLMPPPTPPLLPPPAPPNAATNAAAAAAANAANATNAAACDTTSAAAAPAEQPAKPVEPVEASRR